MHLTVTQLLAVLASEKTKNSISKELKITQCLIGNISYSSSKGTNTQNVVNL